MIRRPARVRCDAPRYGVRAAVLFRTSLGSFRTARGERRKSGGDMPNRMARRLCFRLDGHGGAPPAEKSCQDFEGLGWIGL